MQTYSSVKGVIFFSGSSSSAKFFWNFSQFWPVALGMLKDLNVDAGCRNEKEQLERDTGDREEVVTK